MGKEDFNKGKRRMNELKKLKDVSNIFDSLHQTPQYVSNSDYKIIRVVDIKEGSLSLEKSLFVDYYTYLNYTKKHAPKEGDIIITRVGSYGICSYVKNKENFCLGQNLALINPQINTKYLYYCLISPRVKEQIEKLVVGTTQKTLSLFNIANLNIYVHEASQQQAIADVLSSFDDKIELNNKITKNLEKQAQSLYKHWFVDFEFPDKNGKPYKSNGGKFKESELGLIPEDWKCCTIFNVCKRISKKVNDNNYEVLSAINSGELIPSKEYFDKQVFSTNTDKYICVEPGNFAYNPARANIGSIGMNKFNYMGCVSPVYIVVEFEKNYEWFWEYTIKSEKFKELIKQRSSGSVRQNFDFNSFASIKIIYPSKEIVVKFNDQFLQLYKTIEQLKIENQKLAEMRDYLLPKLMSGEIKVEKR